MIDVLNPGGASNSHLAAKNGRPTPLGYEAGVDTWRLTRYLDSDRDLARIEARATIPAARGSLVPEQIAGHRVGVVSAHRLLFIEGHPAVEGLARPRDLPAAEERVLAALDAADLPAGRDGGCGRLDTTAGLFFSDGRQGRVFLAALAALDVPRAKPAVYGRPPETVYWMAARSSKKLARAYDKGLEAGTAPPGQLIRLENQTRYTKEARRAVRELDPEYVERKFAHRFAPVAASADGITAATLPALADELRARVQDGRMTPREAMRLGGFLLLGDTRMPNRTARRHRSELRRHGLVLSDPLTDPVDVDLGPALDAALAAWSTDG